MQMSTTSGTGYAFIISPSSKYMYRNDTQSESTPGRCLRGGRFNTL